MRRIVGGLWVLVVAACGGEPNTEVRAPVASPPASATASAPATNASGTAAVAPAAKERSVMLAPWTGEHGGLPAFDRVKVSELKEALEVAMAEKLAEVVRIANEPAAPTFDNTIVALELAGKALERVQAIYGIYTSTMNDDAVQAIEREMEPKLAALDDTILQNAALFARVLTLYEARAKLGLNPEQERLLWLDHTNFVRAGAKLSPEKKKQVFDLNQKLAALHTQFGQNVLAEEGTQMVLLERDEDLAGLPESLKKSAATAAETRGQKGKFAIVNTRSSVDPFLTYSTRRDLREKVFRMFIMRGDNDGAHNNNGVLADILLLRAERAKILGYKTHAHYRLELSMAKTPERAMELMEAVWKPAVLRVREEVADMQKIADKEKAKHKIEAWDYRYYAEKVRKAKFDLDQNEVKPYLELEALREGMFWVAQELFGLKFEQVSGVPVYHPDVRVFRVTREGAHVGYWYFDPYARQGKRSGAWMNEYRPQSMVSGSVPTIVSNNANFIKGKPGEPVLISWDDARTLFHEFGHALHGLHSHVTYPQLAGTSVARDYVEFPSQILERWVSTPEVLNRFALHHQTKQPMPKELIAKLERSAKFNLGFSTVEYLASALVDMKLHLQGDKRVDARAFERETLSALGMPKEVVMRHRMSHFGHIFGSDGYSAGYYSYLWADTISADAYEAFTEAKGPYDKKVAKALQDNVLSVGNSIDPADGYRKFRGRDAGIAALMRHRGFAVPKEKK